MKLTTKEIMEIIPHRHPFLLIDTIEELVPGVKATGKKCVTYNEPHFAGHFPQEPVMPGVLIVEALAQTGAVAILSKPENKGKIAYFASINNAKFKNKVVPGDTLTLEVEIIKEKGPMGVGKAKATNQDGKVAVIAELTFAKKERKMFQKILIANRGEIALRIIRACRELGIRTVAIYSQADAEALHAQLADEAICIGPSAAAESYLDMERILSATIATKAEAIHPGFGFLSENSRFVEMCEKCNVAFIGPSAEVISRMGNKSEAKNTMRKAKVPVVPGTKEPVYTVEQALEAVKEIGFPVMIKASAGGGGKGMRVAGNEQEFAKLFETAQQESVHSFSDNTMYLERFVENPRHVEVQILADKYGNVVHLGERDCSVQRRHQKMIEESPCIAISDDLRKKMGETAVRAAKAAGYESAGTIEFLLDQSGEFYFMEMNTRIQVEHPVTEFVSGVDLIKEQICIAAGEPLSVQQKDIEIRGHAMECRINAEDPERHFMPCPGKITDLHLPGGNGIRVDTAVYNDYAIPPYYDSMIAKIIVYDKDRRSAIRKMISALGEVAIEGVKTNVDFLYELLNQPDFQEGNITTDFIPQHYPDL